MQTAVQRLSTHGQTDIQAEKADNQTTTSIVPSEGNQCLWICQTVNKAEATVVHAWAISVHTVANVVHMYASCVPADGKRMVMAMHIVSLLVRRCANACQVDAKEWADRRSNRDIHEAMSRQTDDCGETSLRPWRDKGCPCMCKQASRQRKADGQTAASSVHSAAKVVLAVVNVVRAFASCVPEAAKVVLAEASAR